MNQWLMRYRSALAAMLCTLFAFGCGGNAPDSKVFGTAQQAASTIDIGLTGSSAPNPVPAGTSFSYTFTVTHVGGGPAHNVTIDVPLGGAQFVSLDPSSTLGFICTVSASTVSCTNGNAFPQSNPPMVLKLNMLAPSTQGTLTITADTHADETDSNTANNSVTITTNIGPPSMDLSLALVASPTSVGAGSAYTYVATVQNAGPSIAGGVTYQQTLPAGVAFTGSSSANWGCSSSGSPVVVSCAYLTNMGAGVQSTLTLNVVAPPVVGTAASTGSVAPTANDPDVSNNTATANVNVTPAADLTVAINATPSNPPAQSAVSYTISPSNLGPNDAQSVTVTTTFPAGFTNVSTSVPGWNCNVTGTTSLTLTCTTTTLASGAATSFTVTALAPAATGNQTVSTTIAATTTDPSNANNSASATVTVAPPSADLSVTLAKSGTPGVIDANAGASYLATLTNAGPSVAGAVTAKFSLDPGAVVSNETLPPGWSCSQSGQLVTCSLSGSMLINGTATLAIDVLPPPNATSMALTVNASNGTVNDPNLTNNSASDTSSIVKEADLGVAVAPVGGVAAGASVSFAINPTNGGRSQAQAVSLVETIPAGFTNVQAPSANGWSCSVSVDGSGNSVVTCSRATLDAAASAPLTVTANAPTATGPYQVTTAISSSTADPSAANNSVTTAVNVTNAASDLALALTGPASANSSQTLNYTATVSNAGPSPATGLTVTFTLPANATLSAGPSGTGWTCGAQTGSTLACTQSSSIANGQSAPALSVSFTAPAGGTVQLSAVASSSAADANTANNSASVTTTVTAAADLSAPLTASATSAPASSAISFTLAPNNAGPAVAGDGSANGVTVTATLPSGFVLGSISAAGWNCTSAAGSGGTTVITCKAANLAVGAGPTIVLAATTPATTGNYTISSSISSTTFDQTSANNSSSATVTIGAASADLSVTLAKSGTPGVIEANAGATYVATVTNAGPSIAGSVTAKFTLDAGTVISSRTLPPGWSCSQSGQLVTCTLSGTMLVNGTANLSFDMLPPPDVTSMALSVTVTNGTVGDPDLTNNTASNTSSVTEEADLSVAVAPVNSLPGGTPVTFAISPANGGRSRAQAASLVETIPAGFTNVQAAPANGWSCTVSIDGSGNSIVTCSRSTFDVAASASLSVTATAPMTAGTYTVTTAISSSTNDPNTGNNSASTSVNVTTPSSDLALTLTGPASANASQTLSYTATVSNGGPSPAAGLAISFALPSNATLSGTPGGTGWSCAVPSGGTITCNQSATLANGQTAPALTISFTGPPAGGTVSLTATASSNSVDANLANNSASVSTTVTLAADVSVPLVASPSSAPASSAVTFTLSPNNAGPSIAGDGSSTGVTVTATLPAGFALQSTTASGWTCSNAPGSGGQTVITCYQGSLAVGAGPTIVLVANAPSATGNYSIGASITSTTFDQALANNNASATVTVTAPSADVSVALTKSGTAGSIDANAGATFVATVANAGPSIASSVTATFDLDPGTIASNLILPSGWSCTQTGQVISCALAGQLLVNGSANLRFDVLPNPDVTSMVLQVTAGNGSVADPDLSNNTASLNESVAQEADVSVAVSPVGGVPASSPVTFAISTANGGRSTAKGLSLVETIPAAFTNVQAPNANGWTCSVAPDGSGNSVVTCAMPSMGSAGSANLVVTATSPSTTGSYAITTAISSSINDPNLANNSASTSVSVTSASADLAIALSGPANADASQTLTYLAHASSQGPSPAANLTITFALPANATFVGSSGGGWSCSPPAGGSLSCTQATPLTTGQTSPDLSVSFTGPANGGSVLLSASASSDSIDPNLADNSASVTTNVTTAADVSVPLVASAASVPASSAVIYTLTPTNSGPSVAGDGTPSGVTVTATLPAGFVLTSTSASGWSCANSTGGAGETIVTCNAGSIAAGASSTIQLATESPAATGSYSITASIASTTFDQASANNNSTVVTTVSAASSDMVIALSGPASANAGDLLTYVATVNNAGPSDTDAVAVTIPIPSGMSFSAGSGTGWSCVEATPGGVDSVVCSLAGTLANAQTAPSVSVQLGSPVEGGNVSVTATVSSSANDPIASNNTASVSTAVTPQANVGVSLVASASTFFSGDTVSYTVGVNSAGPSTAQSLEVDFTAPSGVVTSASGIGWSCTVIDTGAQCLANRLNVGSAPAITVLATAPAVGGPLVASVTVTSATADPDASNNSSSTTITVNPSADVLVSVNANPNVLTDSTLEYTVSVFNAGPSDANNLTLSQTLPAGETFAGSSGTGWSCTGTGTPVTVTCQLAFLAANTSAPPLLVDTVAPPTSGATQSSLVVAANEHDPLSANNQAAINTTIDPFEADLAVHVSHTVPAGTFYAGNQAQLTLQVDSVGPNDAQGVTVTAQLPNARDISATGTGWSCGVSGTTVTCTLTTLASGSAQPISVLATLDQNLNVTASVSASTDDPALANNSATDAVAVTGLPNVGITASGPKSVKVGDAIAYLVSVTNNGASDATGVSISGQLPAGATYVSATGTGWSCTPGAATGTPKRIPLTCAYANTLASSAHADFTVNVTAPSSPGDVVGDFTLATSTPNAGATLHASVPTTVDKLQAFLATGGGCSSSGTGSGATALLLLLALLLRKAGSRAREQLGKVALASVALVATTAVAQSTPATGFDVQRFKPGPGAYDLLGVESPRLLDNGWHAGLFLNGSDEPLALRLQDTGALSSKIVNRQFTADLLGSVAIGKYFELGAVLPATLQSTTTIPALPGTSSYSPSGGGLGDLRVVPKVHFFGEAKGFSLGFSAPIVMPTGGGKDFLGAKGFGVDPHALIEWGGDKVRLAANLGFDFRKEVDFLNLKSGSEFTYGAAAEVSLRQDITAIATIVGGYGLTSSDSNAFNRPLEVLGAVRWLATESWSLELGGGPGLTQGYGTPAYRVVLGASWRSPVEIPDRDKDGIADAQDACVSVPGVANSDPKKNGCPKDTDDDGIADAQDACVTVPGVASRDPKKNGCPLDTDEDGIADAQDACVTVPGVRNTDPKKNGCPLDSDDDGIADARDACPKVPGIANSDPNKNGCPPDTDNDGIADAEDACVTVPGVRNTDPKKNGCPRDTDNDGIADAQDACVTVPGVANPDPALNGCPKDLDGDGIADARDACPLVPGVTNPDPKKNGCPVRKGPKVVIQGNKLVIFEKLYFAFNKDVILKRSFPILNQVATTLADHPELQHIRIEGHTDSKGKAKYNLDLSQRRAASVARYLVTRGINNDRLQPLGYGDTRPVDTNLTARGRERNRRVEFTILNAPALTAVVPPP